MNNISNKVTEERHVTNSGETTITKYPGSKFFVEIGKRITPQETNENILGKKGCGYFMKIFFERYWFGMLRDEKILSQEEIVRGLYNKGFEDAEELVEYYISELKEKEHPRGRLGFYGLIVYKRDDGLYHCVDHFDG